MNPDELEDEFLDYNPLEGKPEPVVDKEKPLQVEVTKCDPVTRKFKRVKTRRIRKHDFYGVSGKLIDDESED